MKKFRLIFFFHEIPHENEYSINSQQAFTIYIGGSCWNIRFAFSRVVDDEVVQINI